MSKALEFLAEVARMGGRCPDKDIENNGCWYYGEPIILQSGCRDHICSEDFCPRLKEAKEDKNG